MQNYDGPLDEHAALHALGDLTEGLGALNAPVRDLLAACGENPAIVGAMEELVDGITLACTALGRCFAAHGLVAPGDTAAGSWPDTVPDRWTSDR
jgi:hypothetical protein